MKIYFATHNQNKLREVDSLLNQYEVIGLDDLGVTSEIPETGSTLDENAFLKANYLFENFKVDCFADDTGLEVNYLDGAPGVYSARYAGDQKDNAANIQLLLNNLKGVEDRSARFRTVICLFLNGQQHIFQGIVNGRITRELSGSEGFGYDPVFVPEGYEITFAEMSLNEKNAISHRGRAIKKLSDYLSSIA